MRIEDVHPLKWTYNLLKGVVGSVVNRIALDIFTSYHHFKNDNTWKEIHYLDQAIQALEKGSPPHLTLISSLIDAHVEVNYDEIDDKKILETLKAHRYSIFRLTKGVKNNQALVFDVSNYIRKNHLNSSSKPDASNPT